MKKKLKQKNLDEHSFNKNIPPIYMPKKMFKTWQKRTIKNKFVKVKKITKCTRCGKPIEFPFGGCLCGNCEKQWDIQRWARTLARHHKGKAIKCEKCGLVTNKGIDWHHWDYSKPLDVISLCKKCHGLAHRLGREEFEKISIKKRMNSLVEEH
jgi:hypothetical protein